METKSSQVELIRISHWNTNSLREDFKGMGVPSLEVPIISMDKMKQPGLILKSAIAVRSKKMPKKCRIPCFPAVRDTLKATLCLPGLRYDNDKGLACIQVYPDLSIHWYLHVEASMCCSNLLCCIGKYRSNAYVCSLLMIIVDDHCWWSKTRRFIIKLHFWCLS